MMHSLRASLVILIPLLVGLTSSQFIGFKIASTRFDNGATKFGDWPNMCNVLFHRQNQAGEFRSYFAFGGSLITPGVILTTAYSAMQVHNTTLKIRCGDWGIEKDEEALDLEPQTRFVDSILIHPLFSPRDLRNDFALLFVQEDFKLGPHIRPIGLSSSFPRPNYYSVGCFVMGWGKDKYGKGGTYSERLREVKLSLWSSSDCETRLQKTRLGERFRLHGSFLCAGGERGEDACTGDGGSPLVCLGRDSYVQVGITSWGLSCGKAGVPGVYADVAHGICFIYWAIRCKTGLSDYGEMTGNCRNWFDEEVERIVLSRKNKYFNNFKQLMELCKRPKKENILNKSQNNEDSPINFPTK